MNQTGRQRTRPPTLAPYDARERGVPSAPGAPGALSERGAAESAVRRTIQVSWQRSQKALVDLDQPAPSYAAPQAQDTVLTRAAGPVLEALAAELGDEPISFILCDAEGVVLSRTGGERGLVSQLDSVDLAPGFSYSESQVGTNGIGTALEVGGAILIDGAEHYTGTLRRFACAGALIHHPVSGALLGVVDITTQARHANPLLLTFAKIAADRIQAAILTQVSALDNALLGDYYLACQRSGGGVIALGKAVFMMNATVQQHFDAADQAAIIDHTRDSRGRNSPHTVLAELPSGLTARLSYQPTFVVGTLAGGIIQIREHRSRDVVQIDKRMPALPGVGGISPLWVHTTREVLAACTRREWVVLEGEVGVGKQLLLRSAHDRATQGRHLVVLDAAAVAASAASADLEDPGGHSELVERAAAEVEAGADLVVRHAHVLAGASLDRLAELLQSLHDQDDPHGPWIALTVLREGLGDGTEETPGDVRGDDVETRLLGFFPRTVQVPPLRHHISDVPVLARLLLNQAGSSDLDLSPAAQNQLMRMSWNGNVTQLRKVLAALGRRVRSGMADVADLPPECHSTLRRRLSPMETLERDAIVEALAVHDGDKGAAAQSLGVSRATVYRKIRHYELHV